ncbi:uncharacterized protein V1510DRAFT_185329, partial [Dipodascopsis tothii]|uniref:uncharacterized protein n=1 Tax=Dipodascopsis tothii TaxID=44089 RepID=UPI0034CE091F
CGSVWRLPARRAAPSTESPPEARCTATARLWRHSGGALVCVTRAALGAALWTAFLMQREPHAVRLETQQAPRRRPPPPPILRINRITMYILVHQTARALETRQHVVGQIGAQRAAPAHDLGALGALGLVHAQVGLERGVAVLAVDRRGRVQGHAVRGQAALAREHEPHSVLLHMRGQRDVRAPLELERGRPRRRVVGVDLALAAEREQRRRRRRRRSHVQVHRRHAAAAAQVRQVLERPLGVLHVTVVVAVVGHAGERHAHVLAAGVDVVRLDRQDVLHRFGGEHCEGAPGARCCASSRSAPRAVMLPLFGGALYKKSSRVAYSHTRCGEAPYWIRTGPSVV